MELVSDRGNRPIDQDPADQRADRDEELSHDVHPIGQAILLRSDPQREDVAMTDCPAAEETRALLLSILEKGDPAVSQANARAMITAATTFLRETEALPDPQRPTEDLAAEMVCYLDRMTAEQGCELARAMIVAVGLYLQANHGEAFLINTVSHLMAPFVGADILKRHEASPAGLH